VKKQSKKLDVPSNFLLCLLIELSDGVAWQQIQRAVVS